MKNADMITRPKRTGWSFRWAAAAATTAVVAALLWGGCSDTGVGGAIEERKIQRVKHGTLADDRNGVSYKTVTIGSQTWMAENLNYGTEGSWCYDNDSSNCVKYGRLYTWSAAKAACPSGWHLPSTWEWATLMKYVGSPAGRKLKSEDGWNYYSDSYYGTNDYGFSALPGGCRSSGGGFYGAGYLGYWWTATEYGSGYA